MNIIADTHTHTLACDHAYSTLKENLAVAKEKGLAFLAMTEHGPAVEGAPSLLHFLNLPILADRMDGIILLKGAEVNILNEKAALDISPPILENLDWVIASMHTNVFTPSTSQAHTNAWLAVAENPLIDVIGHCGDERFLFDYRMVIKRFAQWGKIVEINAHSFTARPGSLENCTVIAQICAEYGVPVVVSSDAHVCYEVGNFEASLQLLKKIGFPKNLILNEKYERFLKVVCEKTGRTFEADLPEG